MVSGPPPAAVIDPATAAPQPASQASATVGAKDDEAEDSPDEDEDMEDDDEESDWLLVSNIFQYYFLNFSIFISLPRNIISTIFWFFLGHV